MVGKKKISMKDKEKMDISPNHSSSFANLP